MRFTFLLVPVLCVTAYAASVQPLAGTQTCIQCHQAQAKTQPSTSMGHALESVAQCTILRENPRLEFHEGAYTTTIVRDGDKSIYSVTDGKETITVPIAYALGLGIAGQTYTFERNGEWYESRVSFYKALHGLDLTMGAAGLHPQTLLEATGRRLGSQETIECLNCHSTGAVQEGKLHTETLTAGLTCERCHGSALNHLQGIRAGNAAEAKMPKLSNLDTESLADFCGGCHRTWATVAMSGPHSINNVRFQPYRLTISKCYDAADKRISCVACHDPHQEVNPQVAAYDSRCGACHALKGVTKAAQAKGKSCPVAVKDCTSCHMPKLDLPGAHAKFTDHRIRIVKAGAPYPD